MLAKDLRSIICCSILMSWETIEGFLLQTSGHLEHGFAFQAVVEEDLSEEAV